MSNNLPSLRQYEVIFMGSNAQGKIPMFTVVEAVTGKGAIRAFVERFKPVTGWFLGNPEDITDRIRKESDDAGSHSQK
ncbi:hypothetical protein GL503_20355 [Salmonella enterica]|uniref:Uncharacterized protein n=1 Tax=Salmonella enterica I TaxID=59201 RepID=A0A403QIU0_SALET|nr:hypothetical protein [Salmonella enterica]EHX2188017.1 hypothetical protein [Salmonella enterica subsp. enterica serovar Kedougou]MML54695.1 hypothetical protein [Salmonella enterica subsp. enterica serovar Kidderminster]